MGPLLSRKVPHTHTTPVSVSAALPWAQYFYTSEQIFSSVPAPPVAVPGADLHHGLGDGDGGGQEAVLLLLHQAAQAALVVTAEGPDLALAVQHHGVHPPGRHLHRLRHLLVMVACQKSCCC